MKIETYACDVCAITKQEANHWWKIYLVTAPSGPMGSPGFLILPWDHPDAGGHPLAAHICGQQHLLEWVSRNAQTTKQGE